MKHTLFNLLSDQQLLGLGFSEDLVPRISAQMPLNSVLDLLDVDGVDFDQVRRLLDQGIIANRQDQLLLAPQGPIRFIPSDLFVAAGLNDDDDDGTLLQDGPKQGSTKQDGTKKTGKDKDTADTDGTADVETIEAFVKKLKGPINDCTSTQTIPIRATGEEFDVTRKPGGYGLKMKPVIETAKARARVNFYNKLVEALKVLQCTNPKCLDQQVLIQGPSKPMEVYSLQAKTGPPNTKRGWQAKYLVVGKIQIKCSTLV